MAAEGRRAVLFLVCERETPASAALLCMSCSCGPSDMFSVSQADRQRRADASFTSSCKGMRGGERARKALGASEGSKGAETVR